MKTPIRVIIYILSLIVIALLSPLGVIYTAIKNIFLFKLKTWTLKLIDYLEVIVIAIDQICQILLSDLLNDIAIKKRGYSFGDPDDTIGYCIRKNHKKETLTLFGKFIQLLIDHKKYI